MLNFALEIHNFTLEVVDSISYTLERKLLFTPLRFVIYLNKTG